MKLLFSLAFLCGSVLSTSYVCTPDLAQGVYADMHDGDEKTISYTEETNLLTITSTNTTQTWVVEAEVDTDSCSAMIDFDVEGKPNPPPVSLQMIITSTEQATGSSGYWMVFKDPSGTLADADFPLNVWVPDTTAR